MGLQTFTLLTIVVTLACHNEPVTPGSAAGLTVTVPLSRTELQPGQPDTVTITLTNTNDYSVSLNESGCPLLPYITNAHGVTVVPTAGDWACIAVLRRLDLAAGERQTRHRHRRAA